MEKEQIKTNIQNEKKALRDESLEGVSGGCGGKEPTKCYYCHKKDCLIIEKEAFKILDYTDKPSRFTAYWVTCEQCGKHYTFVESPMADSWAFDGFIDKLPSDFIYQY